MDKGLEIKQSYLPCERIKLNQNDILGKLF